MAYAIAVYLQTDAESNAKEVPEAAWAAPPLPNSTKWALPMYPQTRFINMKGYRMEYQLDWISLILNEWARVAPEVDVPRAMLGACKVSR